MKNFLLVVCLVLCSAVFAQPRVYTTSNAHSHNDYEKPRPFHKAYKHQFGSIEADIFLLKESDDLLVAHHRSDIDKKRRTLDSLYLQPLADCIAKNKGFAYADTSRKLQLLIDIKTEAVPTLNRLITQLRKYPALINSPTLQIVISGNRPPADSFIVYPSFILFDGVVGNQYSTQALSRIPLFSANFSIFSKWNGAGSMSELDRNAIERAISEVHGKGKQVRFWGAPDGIDAWKQFISLKADFINTDRIEELSQFLQGLH